MNRRITKRNLVIASVIMVALTFVVMPPASADDCSNSIFVRNLLKKFTEECKQQEGADATTSECTSKPPVYVKLVNTWNSLANNGPATIGPRAVEYGNTQTGNLLSPSNRTFLSPPLDKNTVTISIKKSDNGKATCVVSVCKVDINGNPTNLDTFTFNDNAAVGTEYKKTFSGLKDFALQVVLNGKGGLGKRFPFTFRATKS